MTTYPTTKGLYRLAGRDRITVDGIDVTDLRGAPTPFPRYTLTEPFAYGATSIQFPQVDAAHEADQFGTGELSWVREGANVVISRVFDTAPEEIDYRGRVISIEAAGRVLNLDIGGQFSGPANLLQHQTQLFRYSNDVGHWAQLATLAVGLNFTPWFGPTTGIVLTHVGGQSHLSWAQYVCAMSQDTDGLQRSLMPTVWGGDTWAFEQKDYTTRHLTVFNDDATAVLNVVQDASEAPNVIYGTGITPDLERITNAKWPNVFAGPAPDYPMAGGVDFGLGTTDADTVNGDGITVLYIKLREMEYLPFTVPNTGVYTSDFANAVKKLQGKAGLTKNGVMSVDGWDALYDNNVTGYKINGAYIAPLAEDDRVREWNRSSNGAILGRNPLYDPNVLRVERTIDFGAGITKAAMIAYAEGIINRSATMKNWAGTVRLEGVSVFAGEHDDSDVDPLTAADIVPFRSIRPGMNLWAPYFDGGTLFHISGADPDATGVTLRIDTQARDLVEVRAILERDADSRRDVRREWLAQNQTKKPSSHGVAYDESFGIIDRNVKLQGGRWNLVPVIAGQHGQVNRTRLQLVNDKPQYAAAAFSVKMTEKRLDRRVGNPLVVSAESVWEKESLQDWYDDDTILWAVGDGNQPGGFSPRRKLNDDNEPTGAPITGRLTDAEPWPFIFVAHTAVIVYLAIYPDRDCTLKKGRIMWPQLDSAA